MRPPLDLVAIRNMAKSALERGDEMHPTQVLALCDEADRAGRALTDLREALREWHSWEQTAASYAYGENPNVSRISYLALANGPHVVIDQAKFQRVIDETLRGIETTRPEVWAEYLATKGRTDLVLLEERLGAALEAAFPGVPWEVIYWDAKAIATRRFM